MAPKSSRHNSPYSGLTLPDEKHSNPDSGWQQGRLSKIRLLLSLDEMLTRKVVHFLSRTVSQAVNATL
ncbi:hypothetical protein CIHG_02528 [Coccidioides immitis H538.4]|uniref:Uncharacterized protein n=2 Tax=Coccidioides immitis TaxID=5501 RepID=A0A0J8RLD3_COCIT|nr:hypothetical protein CIRG_02861 [Coccidioides immitis RMSCC 2394]KMU84744.1 hypothetical protein CIHG_02528 [Coccidioides immitis H538.4]